MPRITRSAMVPYSAKQMYDLVNDVTSYPAFLPGCSNATLLSHTEDKMRASIEVSKIGISKTFITENSLTEGESININLVDGPFTELQGAWNFIILDEEACKIEFNLEFEFQNLMVKIAFGKIFNELVNNMVDAFTKRAKQVYGK